MFCLVGFTLPMGCGRTDLEGESLDRGDGALE